MKKMLFATVLAMLCLIFTARTQLTSATGKITDEQGNPLSGTTISVKGTNITVTTNENGIFKIVNLPAGRTLVVSRIGFKSHDTGMLVRADLGTIILQENNHQLEEININAGYYTVTERERTGSISRVTAQTIGKQPISNPLQALQGRVSGVQITQQTGVPGGGFSVQIRGRSSINTQVGNDPLYLIDGVPYPSTKVSSNSSQGILTTTGASPMSFINPKDIESIEILKDADATAIYGSRGANGVVLIKTKRGELGQTKIQAGLTQGFAQVDRRLDLLNTDEYLEMRREAYKNDGLEPNSTDYDVNGIWGDSRDIDWQKELIGGKAKVTNANLNLSGGTSKMNYQMGGDYYREGTVFPGDFGFNRASIHSSLNLGSSEDRFTANFTFNYIHTQSKLMRGDITGFITTAPNAPYLLDQDGNINWENNTIYENPMAVLTRKNETGTNNLIGNATLSYKVLQNLLLKTSIGYNNIKRDEFQMNPLASFSPVYMYTSKMRESNFSNLNSTSLLVEPQLNYNVKIGNGRFEALFGMSFQSSNNGLRAIKAAGFTSDELMENIASAATLTPFQSVTSQYRYAAAFARLNYNIKDRYYLNITARRDGSSRFGSGKQFANFGAIGAAWIFGDENLIKDEFSFLSFGKLRTSYGITGNDQITDYGYLQLWNSNSGTYQGIPTIGPTLNRIGNPDFAWETNKKAEVAVQLGFLENKLNVEVLYYRNRSSNQLIGDPLPLSTGNQSVQANRPATVQNSGLEVEIGIKLLRSKNWQWTTNLNITFPKNKLIEYPDMSSSADAYNFIIGKPMSIRRTYNYIGVNTQTGLYEVEDYDRNGIYDDKDRYQYKFTGQYYYGGLQNSIIFKQLALDVLIAFTKQNGFSYLQNIPYPPGRSFFDTPLGNQPTEVLRRWRQVNDQSEVQKFSTIAASNRQWTMAKSNGGLSIVDASFLRLKSISLAYTLPEKWINMVRIKAAEIMVQGQNLFTFSNYIGLDPESQTMQSLPPLRTVVLGLNLTL